MQVSIDTLGTEDWEVFRDVRLKALADTPDAFGSTLEKEEGYSEQDWRGRLERGDCRTFVASSAEARAIGLIVVAPYGEELGVFAMWVDSTARRAGIGGRLLDAASRWAQDQCFNKLMLDVADENFAAIKLYESKGFQRTGITGTLPAPRDH